MIKKTFASLTCIALLGSFSACGGSPEVNMSPTDTASVTETSTTSATSTTPTSEHPDPVGSQSVANSPSTKPVGSPSTTEPTDSSDPDPDGEIPAMVQGKWIAFSEIEEPQECTEELESEGSIITIDATRIGSFAFYYELEEILESSDNSVEGVFTYADDSDEVMTPTIRLVTEDDWETLTLLELGTEQAPGFYARCS